MVSDTLTQDTKPGDNLVQYKEGCSLPIGFNCRRGLGPLSKLVDGHNNVLMPPSQSWVAIDEVHPPLGEGINDNDWVKRGWTRVHFLSEHLARVTLLNRFNTIFKYSRPKITILQNVLSRRKPR